IRGWVNVVRAAVAGFSVDLPARRRYTPVAALGKCRGVRRGRRAGVCRRPLLASGDSQLRGVPLMPIHFHCPECQEFVQVSEALAGLHTRCPRCSASVPVPDESRGAYTAAPAEVVEPAAARGGWQPPSARYGDYGPPVRLPSDGVWSTVRSGLTLEFA